MQSFVIISPRSGNNKEKTIEIFLSNPINIFIHNKRFKIRDSDLIQIHQTKAIHICIYVWICALYAKIKISHKIECLYI